MTMEIYAIKDTKVGYMQPFYLQNNAIAIRAFKNARNSTTANEVNTNPEDKELWHLGTFNDQTGVVTSDISFICKAEDVVKEI